VEWPIVQSVPGGLMESTGVSSSLRVTDPRTT
jgi:hypothetical protein